MYARAREQMHKSERDAIWPQSGGPIYRKMKILASCQNFIVVALTTNSEIRLEKASAPNNTIDPGSLEGLGREAAATYALDSLEVVFHLIMTT